MRITSSQTSSAGQVGSDDPIDPNQQALGQVVSLAQKMATQLEQDGPAALQTPEMSAAIGKLTGALTQLQTAATNGDLSVGQRAQLTQIIQALGLADPASTTAATAPTGHSTRDVYEANAPAPGKTHHHHHHGGTKPVDQTDTSANRLGADPSEPK